MQGRSRHALLLFLFLILAIFLQACALIIGLDTDRTLPEEEDAADSAPAQVDARPDVAPDTGPDVTTTDAGEDADADSGPFVPGTLTSTSVDLGATNAGATGSVTLQFTTAHAWPLDGTFDVVFPTGFDVSAATFVSATGATGNFTISKSGQTVTLTRSGGTATSGAVTLTIGNVKNPSTSGATGTYTFTTRTQTGTVVDSASGITGPAITPAGLGSPSVVPASLVAGALGNVDVSFTTLNPIPANGAIDITFPAGFDVSGATFFSQTGSDGTFTPSVSNQVVKLTRSAGTATAGAVSVTLHLGTIRNPRVSGSTGTYLVRTLAAGDVPIDTGTAAASTIDPGALTSTSVTPASLTVGVTGNVVVTLTPTNPWPANGKLDITFPNPFIVTNATFVSSSGSSGGFSVSVAGQTVTVTRDNAGTPTSGAFSITLGSITNGGSTITTGTFTLTTRTNGGVAIDTGTAAGVTFTAGALSSTSVTPASLVAGATGNVVVALTTATSWQANGKLLVTFPSGFVVAGATFVSSTGPTGGFTVSVASQTVTLTRDNTGTATAPGALTFTIGGIKNPPISGTTGTFSLATRSNNNNDIDTSGPVAGVAITPGTLTSVSAAPASTTLGATGNFAASFTLANPWPADGRYDIVFDAGFTVSGATFVSATGADGGFSVSVNGHTVTVIRDGLGTTTAALTAVSITLGMITNPSSAGMTGPYVLTTENASSTPIDTATPPGTNIN